MKYAPLFLVLLLALGGCGKYEVYERNIHYITPEGLETEKALVQQRVQKAQIELSRATATGDFVQIRPAEREMQDAQQQLRIIETEERRRAHTW